MNGKYGKDVKDWLKWILDMDRIRPLGLVNMNGIWLSMDVKDW